MRVQWILLLSLVGGVLAQGDVPKTRPLSEYYHLWQQSPFTVKPVVEQTEQMIENDLDDYVLLGVEVTAHGKLVIVQNIKEQGKRTTISTWDEGTSGFEILEVRQDPNRTLATRVLLGRGQNKGWVGYDPQYLTLKAAPAPATPAARQENQGQNRGRGRDPRNSRRGGEREETRVRVMRPARSN